jgi:hypothetical protein
MPDATTEPQPFEIDEPFALSVTGGSMTGDDQESVDQRKPPSRIRRIVLGTLLVVTLAGLGTLGYAMWQMRAQKDAAISTPPQIGNLRLDQSDDGQQTADYLQTALSAEIRLNHAVGAVYTDGTANRDILFFGGTATIWSPDSDLKSAFGLISDKQGDVTGLHKVDAGTLGGTMKCGSTKSDSTTLAVCGWADHGSVAVAMFPNRSVDESATLLREIRTATQKRK